MQHLTSLIFSLQKKLEHVKTTQAHLDKVITKTTALLFLQQRGYSILHANFVTISEGFSKGVMCSKVLERLPRLHKRNVLCCR